MKGNNMKWISAEEELPRESERVLLFTPYPVFGADYTCVGDRESIAACKTTINRKQVPIFTHWMTLPPKPDQQS